MFRLTHGPHNGFLVCREQNLTKIISIHQRQHTAPSTTATEVNSATNQCSRI